MASCMQHVKSLFSRSNGHCRQFLVHRNGLHTKLTCHRQLKRLLSRPVSQYGQSTQRHPVLVCGYIAIRNQSSDTATDLTSSYPDGYIPEPPPIPIPTPTPVEETILNALGEPTLSSLGLGSHWPSGLVQLALEHMHVTLDLPWWGAIVAGTVVLRILMFPLVILSQKNAANMSNHMPTVQRLQEKFTKTRASGNPLEAARAGQELMNYMKRHKVNPMKNMMVPLAQVPVFLSVFIGVRQMATLPVESMSTGGLLWFTDLTLQDPFYAMPLLTMATFLLTIEFGVDGVKAGTMSPIMKTVLRGMPFVMLPFICKFPAAMLCYWFTSNAFSLCQVMFLKIPAIRTKLDIPPIVKHDDTFVAKKKSFKEGFRESMDNAKLASQMADRERMDAMKFKEAGTGPLQKTYPYDPTKVQAKSKQS